MQFRFIFTLPNVFLTALIVLLTWTSLAQGAAINRDISPARRDLVEEVRAFGADVANANILRRVPTTEPEGEPLVRRDRDGVGSLAARATEKKEDIPVDDSDPLSRRWYTLVEIAESDESE